MNVFSFSGTCYHIGDNIKLEDKGYGERSYCTELQDNGRLAILPESKLNFHEMTKVIHNNRFYQIGKFVNIVL